MNRMTNRTKQYKRISFRESTFTFVLHGGGKQERKQQLGEKLVWVMSARTLKIATSMTHKRKQKWVIQLKNLSHFNYLRSQADKPRWFATSGDREHERFVFDCWFVTWRIMWLLSPPMAPNSTDRLASALTQPLTLNCNHAIFGPVHYFNPIQKIVLRETYSWPIPFLLRWPEP